MQPLYTHSAAKRTDQAASLRTLLGVCSILLSNFKTSLEDDQALLGAGSSSSSSSCSSSSSGGGAEPLGEELRMAVQFRSEKKRVVLRAIRAISKRVDIVAGMAGLKAGPVVQAKKGEKSRPATTRGFAGGGGGSMGGGSGSGGDVKPRRTSE